MPRPHLELLAPARDADIGIEAVNHGADAVYIGGPGFGARDKASNSVADIARLAAHAHRFGARIFVTVNTILRDDELEPARRLLWQLYEAGADAAIVQDMGLLELDLPPLQLHASTQTDIRTPGKARFLQDAGFSQMVLARELDLAQIRAITAVLDHAVPEFFVHGALCVAYSGQCFVSHAMTGRSANRGSCSQECRQPYTVLDAANRIVAHDKHVLSLKDNDQSANLEALVDAGIRSFKIEGRYKDMATVKNIVAHYRQRFDALLERQPDLVRASSGRSSFTFDPDPRRGFNRGGTDYFVNGRKIDIGAFDSPKHVGEPIGRVTRVAGDGFEIVTDDAATVLHNGDALTWWDRQGELQGVPIDTATALGGGRWRVVPSTRREADAGAHASARAGEAPSKTNATPGATKDLRPDLTIHRNRDMAWERLLARPSADRRIAVDITLATTSDGLELSLKDEDGHTAAARVAHPHDIARDAARAEAASKDQIAKLGTTIFTPRRVRLAWREPLFVPTSVINALRRDAITALEASRASAFARLPRAVPVDPPVPYPDDTLTYLANVYNAKAAAFYARHGVKVIDAAYESHEETGDVSLMITKHCVRWSLSLCPKQAKGVTGVQGTVRAEPMTIVHGSDRFTLRFDCKPCEMHVVGRMQKHVLRQAKQQPLTFYRARPA
jgi:putative protease